MRNYYLRRYSNIRKLCCIWVSCRFSKLEDENIHPTKKCIYGGINYSNSVNGIRYQLGHFYSIRDKLEWLNKVKSDRDDNKLKGIFFKIYDCSVRKISDVFPEITCPSEETTKNLLQQACGKEEPRLPSTLYVTPNVGSSQKIKCEETPSRTALYPVILSICIILLRIILIS